MRGVVEDEAGQQTPGLTKVLSLVDAVDSGPADLESLPAFLRGQSLRIAISKIDEELPVIAGALRGEDPQQPGQHYYRIMLRARERQPSAAKLQIISAVRRISAKEFPEAQVTG